MDHLRKAKDVVEGFSGKATDLQVAQAHATIALAEAAQDIARKLALIHSDLEGKESTSVAEAQADEPKPKALRRKASEK